MNLSIFLIILLPITIIPINGWVDCLIEETCFGEPKGCDPYVDCKTLIKFNEDGKVDLYLHDVVFSTMYAAFPTGQKSDGTYDYMMCIPHYYERLKVNAVLGQKYEVVKQTMDGDVTHLGGDDYKCSFPREEFPADFKHQQIFFVTKGSFVRDMPIYDGEQLFPIYDGPVVVYDDDYEDEEEEEEDEENTDFEKLDEEEEQMVYNESYVAPKPVPFSAEEEVIDEEAVDEAALTYEDMTQILKEDRKMNEIPEDDDEEDEDEDEDWDDDEESVENTTETPEPTYYERVAVESKIIYIGEDEPLPDVDAFSTHEDYDKDFEDDSDEEEEDYFATTPDIWIR